MLQDPAEQAGAPFTRLHGVPQAPQLSVSVWVLTSQPLPGSPSQFWKPATQVYWQLPSEQPVAAMFGGALAVQSKPQLPQFVASVRMSISQPSAPPLQSARPASQT